jgi:tryptophan synthase alpha chain
MNRIDDIFKRCRDRGQKALMPFITAGDPDLATTQRLLPGIERAGASICELGIAFSDPVADGPVIQASMKRALDQHVRPCQVLEMVARQRANLHMGLMAMVSYSIVYRLGLDSFLRDAAQAGIDGMIFPDLPLEESAPARAAAARHGLVCSFLIAPTTPIERARQIAQASTGFVYLLSRAGVTGESTSLPPDLTQRVSELRSVTDLPIVVGFGISNQQQVRSVLTVADAVIVGSAIMRRVDQHRQEGADAVVDQVSCFVSELAGGLVQADG